MDAALDRRIRARTAPPDGAVEIPPIPTERYTDPAFYEAEQQHLFAASWLFVGHESEWPEPGSYRLTSRSGAPIVVVRGEDGVLRAFYNSCRHRGAPVTRDECGTGRRLTCQYHSWSYGTDGTLKGVPDSRSFVGLNKDDLGLIPVGCDTWDGWVFINEDPNASPLLDFLGPVAEQMAEINGPAMRAVGSRVHPLACNWKLMVDAFLEVYHVRTVHPDNAALLYNDQATTVSMFPNGHSRLTVEKHDMFRDGSIHLSVHVANGTGDDGTRTAVVRARLGWPGRASGASRSHGVVRNGHGSRHVQHGTDPSLDLVAGRQAVLSRMARTPHPPFRARRRPQDRRRSSPRKRYCRRCSRPLHRTRMTASTSKDV